MLSDLKLLFSGSYIRPEVAVRIGKKILVMCFPPGFLLASFFLIFQSRPFAPFFGWLAVPFLLFGSFGIMLVVGESVYLSELRDWKPQRSTALANIAGKVAGLLCIGGVIIYVRLLCG